MILKIPDKFSYFMDLGTQEYKLYVDITVKEKGVLSFYHPTRPPHRYKTEEKLTAIHLEDERITEALEDIGFIFYNPK